MEDPEIRRVAELLQIGTPLADILPQLSNYQMLKAAFQAYIRVLLNDESDQDWGSDLMHLCAAQHEVEEFSSRASYLL